MSTIRAWIGLIGLSLMASIAFVDFTIVYTSLPAIQMALNVPVIKLQLIMSIFSLSLATSLIFVGKLADQFGKRKLFFIGSLIFTFSAFGAGFSSSFEMLVFFRFLQGIAAAIIFTSSSLLAPLSFAPEQQPLAISVYNAITGLGLALGPFLGGVIVDALGWEWIFFINIPVAIIGFILCLGNVNETKKQENVQHDILGFIVFSLGLGLIIFFLSYGNVLGWSSLSFVGGMGSGIVLLVLLIFIEKRESFPLLDIEDITNPKILLCILMCLAASVMTGVLMLFVPLYLSGILAFSTLYIGFFMLSTPVMQVLVSVFWAKSSKKWGVIKMMLFGIITCFFSASIMVFFSLTTSSILVVLSLLLMGIIWGVTNASIITIATTAVPEEKASGVMGLICTSWNVAACVLIALTSVVFSQVESGALQKNIETHHIQLTVEQNQSIEAVIADPQKAQVLLKKMDPLLSQEAFTLFKHSFMSGFHVVMEFSSLLLLVCFILCVRLIKRYDIVV